MSGDEIEFTFTGKDHRRLKVWANAVATAAAIVIGLAGALKPPDPVGKTSYDELKKAIESNESAVKQNHEDIVALRNFLDGYLKSSIQVPVSTASGAASFVVPVKIQKPSKPGASASAVVVLPAPSAPQLPKIGTQPSAAKLPEYGDLKN
jgi:hypothetical protein